MFCMINVDNYIFIGAIVNITVTTFSIYIHMANGNAGIHVCTTHAHVIKIIIEASLSLKIKFQIT